MSLRARINSPEERTGRGEDGHLVASYRAKLLEEIDLAEMSALSRPSAGPGWNASSATSSAARVPSCPRSNAPS